MKFSLKVWRQKNKNTKGGFEKYEMKEVSPDSSFLEMIDQLNEQLNTDGKEPVTFDHDCREGICGSCAMVINGRPHGPTDGSTTCQVHMRSFKDGEELVLEPFRAKAFPVIKDLMVDRTAFDRISQEGGYVSVNTGAAGDANIIPIEKEVAEQAFNAAACIGCGACVAACKNSSAMLFVGAKVSHLAAMPQGEPERASRALGMVRKMDEEGFGHCTNQLECEAVCPKLISSENISKLNKEFSIASLLERKSS